MLKVILNGKRLPVKAFKDYVELYTKGKEDDAGNPVKIIYENVNERWEVAVAMSDNDFQQVSFVNSIATTKVVRLKLTQILNYYSGERLPLL